MSTRLPFVYLTSSPFSGSTLFSFLANTHPAIATVGEMTGPVRTQDPETYRCSCGEKIRRCPFWKQVVDRMASLGFQFDPGNFDTRIQLGRGPVSDRLLAGSLRFSPLESIRDNVIKLMPVHRDRLKVLLARNEALAASILQITRRSVFFDASKNPLMIRHLSQSANVDLRVVHLVRDVRGATLSMRVNQGKTDWRRLVITWIRTNHAIERHLRHLPDERWIRIRYEDLCCTPEVTLNNFFKFCGLEQVQLPREFSAVTHHIVGNRMRLSGIGEVRLNEDWRCKLAAEEAESIACLAGDMHMRYGYPRMRTTDLEH